MPSRRSNPGLWLSFGMSLRPVGRSRGCRGHRHAGPDRGRLRPLAAGPRFRLALAAALVVASLLSPGGSGACAGCCGDGAPTVAAPLAAGIAPVHAEAVVDAASHRCCHAAALDAVAVAGSCCAAAVSETADGEATAAPADPCDCDLVPRDEAPALPVRTEPDLRSGTAVSTHGFHDTAVDVGRMPVAIEGAPSTVHPRPLRVLYGVWRN